MMSFSVYSVAVNEIQNLRMNFIEILIGVERTFFSETLDDRVQVTCRIGFSDVGWRIVCALCVLFLYYFFSSLK